MKWAKRLSQRLSRHRGEAHNSNAEAQLESSNATPHVQSTEVAKPNKEALQSHNGGSSQTTAVHTFGSESNQVNSLPSATQSGSPSTSSPSAPGLDESRDKSATAHSGPAGPSTKGLRCTIDGLDGDMNFSELMEVLNTDVRRFRDNMIVETGLAARYEQLDPSKNQIRLLDLEPGFWNDVFEALSYTWGQNIATSALIVDEISHLIITQNLEHALRHIRSETECKTLWIDAVCIDQSNDIEKADQVRRMLDIYRLATQVLVWLGPAADNSDLAMDLIERMPTIDFQGLRQNTADYNDSGWSALRALYRRTWWTRVWVVQESAIAKVPPLVGCGQRWLPWETHERAYKLIVDQLVFPNFALPRNIIHGNVAKIFHVRRRIERTGTNLYIGTILEDVKCFQATNPRDKVFAIYGLIEDRFKRYITVDYTMSVRDVFVSMTEFMVTLEPHWILRHATSNTHGLPSWVPDWSESELGMTLWKQHVYSAGGPKLHPPFFSNPSGQVWLHGEILTVIIALAETPCWTINKTFDDVRTVINDYEQFLQDAATRHPDLLILQQQAAFRNDAFSRTICADIDPNRANTDWVQNPTGTAPCGRAPDDFYDLLQVLQGRASVPPDYCPSLPAAEREKQYTHRLIRAASIALCDNTFFVTSWGLIGVASEKLQVNDRVAIIFGVDMPVILRPVDGEQEACTLIGPAYVHHIMDGLALGFEIIEKAHDAQGPDRPFICLV